MVHRLESLQQLLPALCAQSQQLRMDSGAGRRFGGGFADQINGAFQARIHAGQLRVRGDRLPQESRLVGRQLTQQQSCQAGLESVARVCRVFNH
jgi:hypothetical protein